MSIGIVRGYDSGEYEVRSRDHLFTIISDGSTYDIAIPDDVNVPLFGGNRLDNLLKFSPIKVRTAEDMLTVLTRSLEYKYYLVYEFDTDYETIKEARTAEQELVQHTQDYRTGKVLKFNNDEEGVL